MGVLPARNMELFLSALAGVVAGFILALFLLWTAVSYTLSSEIVAGRLILTATGLLILVAEYWLSLVPLILAEALLTQRLARGDSAYAARLGVLVGLLCTTLLAVAFSTLWFSR